MAPAVVVRTLGVYSTSVARTSNSELSEARPSRNPARVPEQRAIRAARQRRFDILWKENGIIHDLLKRDGTKEHDMIPTVPSECDCTATEPKRSRSQPHSSALKCPGRTGDHQSPQVVVTARQLESVR